MSTLKCKAHLDDSLLMKPPSAMAPKSIASSKRKSKEPIKAISKKPKLSPPLPREDFKIRLPAANTTLNTLPPPPAAANADKPLMPPPTAKAPIAVARHKSTPASSNSNSSIASGATQLAAATLPFHAPPHHQGMQMAAPGNRTPIAKRYQPILPKASRPNPFANIPSDVNRLLKDAGTEIKSIASQAKPHVYGPKSQELKMGPPPVPVNKSNSNHNSNSSNSSNNNGSSSKSNNYLNLALFNASKSKGKEAPPGCRTPMYTPNSPIYSPSSPQYVPNYNIPTMPTYKYTPKPTTTTTAATTTTTAATTGPNNSSSSSSSNYLQNMLNGSNSGLASGLGSLFPTPPTKADQNTNPAVVAAAAAVSSAGEDAPEKQQVKVKSLLNSCNINIPSSLSITISRDNGDASSPSNAAHAKHKSPVNNYIEIVKLPDQPAAAATAAAAAATPASVAPPEKEPVKAQPVKLPAPPSKTIPSPQHLLARMTPPAQQLPNSSNPPTAVVPPKSSPKMGAGKAVLTPQQSDKKTPSPEKRSAHSPNSGENKSPKATQSGGATGSGSGSNQTLNGDSAAKKFRPILPRQNAVGGAELAPKLPNVLPLPPANSNSNNNSSNNNNNNNSSNKKVPASKKSPNPANPKLSLCNGSNAATPTLAKGGAAKKKQPTPPPATSSCLKMPPPATHPHPHLPNMNAPLGIASATNQLDLSNFLKENLIRAQAAQAAQAAQVAAQAANQSNLLYNFGPAMYNYQQAYLMEQLSRMQRAGNEVFNDYLQKLKSVASSSDEHNNKSVMPMLPTVTLPTAASQAIAGVAAASPKTSPHAAAAKLTPAATPALAKRQPSPRPQAAATSNVMSLAKSK
ncbi:GH23673 [Drosophila grimshawi]|uniref:GH23673 n=1 Tax=Drosophila grimshawi TaxID=7222 RepID=B4K0Q1_DROGR|nr:GH23673 [Drosophila grimshawi]